MAGATCVASALALATPPQNALPSPGSSRHLFVDLSGLTGIPGLTHPLDPASAANAAGNPASPAAVNPDAPTGPLGRARVPRVVLDDAAWLPPVRADLNARVIRIPADASGSVLLETTVYRPDGPGPFPMVVFNHGKMPGDPRQQARSNPLPFAREFVRRGYVVVAPNRRGFAGSGGTYGVYGDHARNDGCDVERNGAEQAADVAATVDYMARQPYVDAAHIAVAGTSHGGLVTIAYGARAARGVRALINFSGGLRQDMCADWQGKLTHAFGDYGAQNHAAARVPSLWLYGDNDSVWSAALVTHMFAAYRAGDDDADAQRTKPQAAAQAGASAMSNGTDAAAGAAQATLVDFGTYKNDAHRLVGDRDSVAIWWPPVEAFLARAGMPTAVRYAVAEPGAPRGTGYAAIDAIGAVPYLDEAGRNGYRNFLKQYPTRAFAVSNSGAWSWAEGGDNPMTVAIANCEKRSADPCRLYAVNNTVVWGNNAATTTAQANDDKNGPAHATVAGNASDEERHSSLASR